MEELELYIDRFKSGEYKDFSLTARPEIMKADDDEAIFDDTINIEGSGTIASDFLILNISINTTMKNTCKICNESITHEISIHEKHLPFPLKIMKSGMFCLKSFIRELIFLNVPRFSECNGSCPERAEVKKYLKQNDLPQDNTEDNKE